MCWFRILAPPDHMPTSSGPIIVHGFDSACRLVYLIVLYTARFSLMLALLFTGIYPRIPLPRPAVGPLHTYLHSPLVICLGMLGRSTVHVSPDDALATQSSYLHIVDSDSILHNSTTNTITSVNLILNFRSGLLSVIMHH